MRALGNCGWDPLDISLARVCCSLVLLVAGLALARPRLLRFRVADLPYFALLGLSGPGTAYPMFMLTVAAAPLAVAVLLNYTAPLFVAILARLVLREKLSPRKLVALGLSLFGLALVTGVLPGGSLAGCSLSPRALLTGLGSGFFYAVNLLTLRRVSGRYSPATVQVWGPLMGLPFLVFARFMWAQSTPALGPALHTAAGILLLMSAGPGLVAFLLVTFGLARVEAAPASILLTVEPLVAGLLGWTVLGEELSLTQGVGMLLVLGAICTVSLESGRGKADLTSPPSSGSCAGQGNTVALPPSGT